MKKLLIVGSNTIHVYNYLSLIEKYFDEIVLITNEKRDGYAYNTVEVDFKLNFKNLIKTTKIIRQTIASFKPTVIHIHQANSYAFYTFLANKNNKIPTVLTTWGSDILVLPNKSLILKKIVQYNLKSADYLTSDSVFMAEEMERLSKLKSDILIANFGINIVPIDIEKENFIYSNRLHKKLYRIDLIIKAFDEFVKNHTSENWKLIIAATGEETDFFKKMVLNLGISEKVEFVGWVDKQQNSFWYSKSKLWISIPESDATSISLLEAMACGCIPIVSDLPANREWVQHNENGIIVSDYKGDFISAALKINTDKAIQRNKERIQIDGTKEANQKKFIELYTSIN